MSELISIVTTLYNYARFIPDLAESIVAQTWDNWEWIIVDDASTDNPNRVLYPYLQKYGDRIKVLNWGLNRGYSACKNDGIRSSRGNYIVMIDADDMLTSKSLELRYEALVLTDKFWVHGEVIVKNGKQCSEESRNWKRRFRQKLKREGKDLTKEYHHRLIHAQSVMMRRELHKKLGLYDPKLRFSSDNEMWRRIIRFGYIPVHIEDFVAVYRVHPDRMARSDYKRKRKNKVKKQLILDVERRFTEGINSENTELW